MDIKKAAEFLGVTPRTIYWLLHKGYLRAVEIRTPLQVDPKSVIEYSQMRRSPGRPAGK
jgi:excisionase family DNA binding protein